MKLYERLQEKKGFTVSDRMIASYILEHYEESISDNINSFAEATLTSVSSVSRFSRKAGYQGFKELQRQLAMEKNDFLRYQAEAEEILKDSNPTGIHDRFMARAERLMHNTLTHTDWQLAYHMAELLVEKEVTLIRADDELQYASYGFIRHLLDLGVPVSDDVMDLEEKNAGVLFLSFDGKDEYLTALAKGVGSGNIPVMLICGQETTDLVRNANYVLRVAVEEDDSAYDVMARRYAVQLILDLIVLYVSALQKDKKNMEKESNEETGNEEG